MIDLIQYRGPDETVFFGGPDACLSSCRLAVIDLGPDSQPVRNEDGSLQCVYNGEIYNHVELRQDLLRRGHQLRTQTDSEVLVHLFEDYGPDFVNHLNGMFALALWDQRRGELWLARDRYGAKPLFYGHRACQFSFASELKSLAAIVDSELDPDAVADYFAFGFVPPPRTIYRGLSALPAGCLMRIGRAGEEVRRYWNPPEIAPRAGIREDAALEELTALLDDAIRLRLRSDVPVGFFLSGGVDSGILVSRAARYGGALKTFSVGFNEEAYNELPQARKVAERAGSAHRERLLTPADLINLPRAIWHSDQPHSDASFLAIYLLSQMAAQDVTVVLSGEGGDEVFYGYEKYAALAELKVSDRWQGLRQHWESNVAIFDAPAIAELLPSLGRQASRFETLRMQLNGRPFTSVVDDAAFLDQTMLLSGNNLVKPDRQGSAHALEARFPYLDFRLADFMAGLPLDLKVRQGVPKYLLRELARRTLPAVQVERKKRMFTVPVGEWMRNGALGIANHPAVKRNEWLDPVVVRTLEREHEIGQANHTRKLRSILHFSLWLQLALPGGMDSDTRTEPRASRLVHAS